MSFKLLGAAAAIGVAALAVPPVKAGDLGGYPPPVEYSGRDYYEPARPTADRYDPRDDAVPPPPPARSFKDDPAPPPPPRRYSRSGCVSRHAIEDRLVAEGWRDFTDPIREGDVGVFKARRPDGRRYLLKVDGCSGEIVDARPLDRVYGPYASVRPYYGYGYGWERRPWGRRYW